MPNVDHYALVVGIDQYQNFSPLRGAVNDANHFVSWLASPEGGNLPPANITTVLSNGVAPEPSHDLIIDEIAFFIDRFAATPPGPLGDRLYIYLAGHGINVGQVGDCGLVVANASLTTSYRNIPGKLLARSLMSSGVFTEVVLFMDCCREVIANNPSGQLAVLNALVPGAGSGTVVEGLATKWARPAREKELPNPDGLGTSVQGLFTHAVVDGLQRAVDESGVVTAQRLREYVGEYTYRLGAEDQSVDIDFDPFDIDICVPANPLTTVYVSVSAPNVDFDVRDGMFDLVAPTSNTETSPGTFKVELVPARYLFCTPAGASFDDYTLKVPKTVIGKEDNVVVG
jgi:hypothetical protein